VVRPPSDAERVNIRVRRWNRVRQLDDERRDAQRQEFKFVNSCFRGNVGRRVNLRELHAQWLGSRIRRHDPIMLIYKLERKCTLIMFATGRFRFMGPFAPDVAIARERLRGIHPRFRIPPLIRNAPLEFQTATVVFALPYPVNLPRFARALDNGENNFVYNPQEFPSISFPGLPGDENFPYHVKLFYSGQVTVTGFDGNMEMLDGLRNTLIDNINRAECWDNEYDQGDRWMPD